MRSFIIVLLASLFLMTGCYKREIEDVLPPVLSSVKDMKYTYIADNDSVEVSWVNSNSKGGLTAIVN